MEWNVDNSADIKKYYNNTYVKFPETGERLFYVNEVTGSHVRGVDEDDEMFQVLLHHDQPFPVKYLLPHKSYFQYDRYAAFLYRIPAQQYSRGLCKGNTAIGLLTGEGLSMQHFSFKLLRAYTSKQNYLSLDQAIKSSNYSTALSPRFAVTASGVIFVDNKALGKVTGDNVILSQKSIFNSDLQKLAGENWKVVNG